ncbi:hypothetical protein FGO68_gene7398 [Halteria grandinella]|uniref:Uncharacterized protein n=1 Tax=Halteria grandinella TaxID=5974 RepID=A0A8J8NH04_HALGN|nr:hypothetical protein FGO68_gene7398 [Halteria grandinella]
MIFLQILTIKIMIAIKVLYDFIYYLILFVSYSGGFFRNISCLLAFTLFQVFNLKKCNGLILLFKLSHVS